MLSTIKKHLKVIIPIAVFMILTIVITTFLLVNQQIKTTTTGDEFTRTEDVIATDFSGLSTDEIFEWCAANNVSCSINSDFSETIEAGGFIDQDVKPGDPIKPGQSVNVNISSGIIPSSGRYRECVEAVIYYVNRDHLSRQGAYDFFVPEYKPDVTQWSVDHAKIDWNTIALARAIEHYNKDTKDKTAIMGLLRDEKFTDEQAKFAIDNLDGTIASH